MTEEHAIQDRDRFTGLPAAELADVRSREELPRNTGSSPAAVVDESLFSTAEAAEFRSRWDTIQAGFVDEPRRAVEEANTLVAGTMKRLAEVFAVERSNLEGQWDRKESVSTEDLRLALRRYRSFFGRLLSV